MSKLFSRFLQFNPKINCPNISTIQRSFLEAFLTLCENLVLYFLYEKLNYYLTIRNEPNLIIEANYFKLVQMDIRF